MIFNIENDNIIKIFLSNGDNFTVDTYEGLKTDRVSYDLRPDSANFVFSFWAQEINGIKLNGEAKIVGTVDKIVAIETMDYLELEREK
tara:strand:+ start:59 stop:322 length:264 start_codon:yes stop_codon:yes gene_type:complete